MALGYKVNVDWDDLIQARHESDELERKLDELERRRLTINADSEAAKELNAEIEAVSQSANEAKKKLKEMAEQSVKSAATASEAFKGIKGQIDAINAGLDEAIKKKNKLNSGDSGDGKDGGAGLFESLGDGLGVVGQLASFIPGIGGAVGKIAAKASPLLSGLGGVVDKVVGWGWDKIKGWFDDADEAAEQAEDTADKFEEASNAIRQSFPMKLSGQLSEFDRLVQTLSSAEKGTVEYKRAIDQINSEYGKYLPNLLSEANALNQVASARDAVTEALRRQTAEEMRQSLDKNSNEKWQENVSPIMEEIYNNLAGLINDPEVLSAVYGQIIGASMSADNIYSFLNKVEKIPGLKGAGFNIYSNDALNNLFFANKEYRQAQLNNAIIANAASGANDFTVDLGMDVANANYSALADVAAKANSKLIQLREQRDKYKEGQLEQEEIQSLVRGFGGADTFNKILSGELYGEFEDKYKRAHEILNKYGSEESNRRAPRAKMAEADAVADFGGREEYNYYLSGLADARHRMILDQKAGAQTVQKRFEAFAEKFPAEYNESFARLNEDIEQQIKEYEKFLDDVKTNLNGSITRGTTAQLSQLYKDFITKRDNAEYGSDEYNEYDQNAYSIQREQRIRAYNSVSNWRQRRADAQQRRTFSQESEERRRRTARDEARIAEDNQFQVEQARIKAMEQGGRRTLAQMELSYRQELSQMKRQYDDLRDQKIAKAKELYLADERNYDYDETGRRYLKREFSYDYNSSQWDATEAEQKTYDERQKARREQYIKDTSDYYQSVIYQANTYQNRLHKLNEEYRRESEGLSAIRANMEKDRAAALARISELSSTAQTDNEKKELADLTQMVNTLTESISLNGQAAEALSKKYADAMKSIMDSVHDAYSIISANVSSLGAEQLEYAIEETRNALRQLGTDPTKVQERLALNTRLQQFERARGTMNTAGFGITEGYDTLENARLLWEQYKLASEEAEGLYGDYMLLSAEEKESAEGMALFNEYTQKSEEAARLLQAHINQTAIGTEKIENGAKGIASAFKLLGDIVGGTLPALGETFSLMSSSIPQVTSLLSNFEKKEGGGFGLVKGASGLMDVIIPGLGTALNITTGILGIVESITSQREEERRQAREARLEIQKTADAYARLKIEALEYKNNSIFGVEDPYARGVAVSAQYAAALQELNSISARFDDTYGAIKGTGTAYGLLDAYNRAAKGLKAQYGWIYDEDYELNPAILADYQFLTAETGELVDHWQETRDLMKQADEELKSIIKDMSGDVGNTFRDRLISAFKDGNIYDAVDDLHDYISERMEDVIGKQLFNNVFGGVYKRLEDDMKASFSMGGDNRIDDDLMRFYDAQNALLPQYEAALEQARVSAQAAGYDSFDKVLKNADGSRGSYKDISESTGKAIEGRLTAIQIGVEQLLSRATATGGNIDILTTRGLSIAEEVRQIQVDSYLALRDIRSNTGEIIEPIKQMNETVTKIEKQTRNL